MNAASSPSAQPGASPFAAPAVSGVCAVVVTYQPDLRALTRLVQALAPQVVQLVVVDNGSTADMEAWAATLALPTRLTLKRLGANLGIAAAQNVGLALANRAQCTHAILFDQDSCPAADMVARLMQVLHDQTSKGERVAAVGPRFIDDRLDNPPPFIQINGLRYERQTCACADAVVPVHFLVASGCLLPLAVLDAVGGMREELFIDYVDIEWGLRARGLGYASYGVCGAHMHHSLGDQPIAFRGRHYPTRQALRHYYMFRNAVWMYRQPHLPLNWKLADGWRLLLKYGFYLLFDKPRLASWRMIHKGLLDGLLRRTGKLNA